MDKKIKLLAVNTVGLYRNGITTVLFDYYSRFDKERFEIHTIASSANFTDVISQFEKAQIKVHLLPSRKKNTVKYFFELLRLIKKHKYDIVHVNGNSATLAIELLAAKLCGCRVRIAHSHNSTCDAKRADRLLRGLFYKTFTHAFACGEMAGRWLFGERAFKLIKNGRQVSAYRYNQDTRCRIRAQLGLGEHTLAIGHIGNFNAQKNHEFLINVFDELVKAKPDSKLFLAGYGYNEQNVKNQVAQLGLADKVVFLGTVDNVPDILQAMDVMALPSLYEGLPLVVVEWQMAALPCVISDTITDECVYTDFVEFEALKSPYNVWAEKLIRAAERKRDELDAEAEEKAKASGYDIDENVKMLMEYFEAALK